MASQVSLFLNAVNILYNYACNVTTIFQSYNYVTAHKCVGTLKKFNLRRAPKAIDIVGFFNGQVQAPTRGRLFYTVILRNRPI